MNKNTNAITLPVATTDEIEVPSTELATLTLHELQYVGGGSGSGVNHGPGNRGTNPNLVGPMGSGITPTNGTKGASATTNCNHDALTAGCAPGVGTKGPW